MLLFLSLRAAQRRSNLAPVTAMMTRLRRFARNDKEAAAVSAIKFERQSWACRLADNVRHGRFSGRGAHLPRPGDDYLAPLGWKSTRSSNPNGYIKPDRVGSSGYISDLPWN